MKILHWLGFHKYKWEETDSRPGFYRGFTRDWVMDVCSEVGECECGAYKAREVWRDKLADAQLELDEWYLKTVENMRHSGQISIDQAIDFLKNR